MRCPHCAGDIVEGSRYCGICGRKIAESAPPRPIADELASPPETIIPGGRIPQPTLPSPPERRDRSHDSGNRPPPVSPRNAIPETSVPTSLVTIEKGAISRVRLPESKRARMVVIGLVLTIDVVVIGTGFAMISSYVEARSRAQATQDVGARPSGRLRGPYDDTVTMYRRPSSTAGGACR